MKGWQAHSTLNWSWVLSLQSQIRLLSDLSTEEQVFVGGQETKRPTHSLLTPPETRPSWDNYTQSDDGAGEGAGEGGKRQTSEQHFFLYWGNELCRAGEEEGEEKNGSTRGPAGLGSSRPRLAPPPAPVQYGSSATDSDSAVHAPPSEYTEYTSVRPNTRRCAVY